MIRRLFIALTCATLSAAYATDTTTKETKENKTVKITLEPGEIVMGEFLEACPAVANATLSKRIQPGIIGTTFQYNGHEYEVRVQSFEDTNGNLPKDMTFKEYVAQNNLHDLKSNIVHPLPCLSFESLDFRHAKRDDGVYFTVVVRKIDR
jgi:hypothetical protein